MIEIIGNFNTAKCFATTLDDGAREQLKEVCDTEAFASSKIRIMPDVHAGKGCTIGTTMTITDKIVPSMVGVDIGCGMYTVYLGNIDIDFEKVDEAAHFIPCGRNVWEGRQERFDLTQLRCYRYLKDSKRLERSLGTLGGGNHFIEIDEGAFGKKYLVIHTGSRNLGKQVADYYQNLAVELMQGKDGLYAKQEQLIAEYKAQGRRSEIQAAIAELHKAWKAKELDIPKDLCYLTGKYREDYLHDMRICQEFAHLNREIIAAQIIKGMRWHEEFGPPKDTLFFHTVHNYIDNSNMIRKGAISAKEGERLLIPINMRDGCIVGIGKGNDDWNQSAPHGAGRIMSRSKARDVLTMGEFKQSMAGIFTTSVSFETIDEAPMVYKPMDEIVENIKDTVDILEIIKPVYNFKASEV